MCGIAGFWELRGDRAANAARIERMIASLHHRGPDGSGVWLDGNGEIALGHRRLAIVDLSVDGHQPMTSASGRYRVTFNGEIYNFLELRRELEGRGHRFRGHSDTEVMLAAFDEWGIAASVEKFVGMFAFAVWDGLERALTLVRDRLGKKPLYFAETAGRFAFASELKALSYVPELDRNVNRDALAVFLRHGYVPSPYTIYRGISKLRPGHMLTVRGSSPGAFAIACAPYWTPAQACERAEHDPFVGDFKQACGRLDALLRDAVQVRMISDVPLGAFLSGGIDSSLVVALMQAISERPVRTFSVGFAEAAYNEADYASAVAAHLKTDHTVLYVDSATALDTVRLIPEMYDEPFGDSSQIPTYLIAKLAREHVTVALSGDGGDELFGGYNRYLWFRSLWSYVGRTPRWFRSRAARFVLGRPVERWDSILAPILAIMPRRLRMQRAGTLMHKVAQTLDVAGPAELYLRLISHWTDPDSVVIGGREPPLQVKEAWPESSLDACTRRMMLLDAQTYLPEDILVKVDRATMAVSLESRSPLLDHRVFEFAARLPLDFMVAGGQGKRILKSILYRYVPQHLVDRPKTGFGIPLAEWLRGPLRDWAESLIGEERLRREGFLNEHPIRRMWQDHLAKRGDFAYPLWNVLMFQAWLERWQGHAHAALQPVSEAPSMQPAILAQAVR